MGPWITVDSATLMNKGFEVIEAWVGSDLLPKDVGGGGTRSRSSCHGGVHDGSVVAQISATDMRMPIQYAYVSSASAVPRLDWSNRLDGASIP
jgi:1-deoxy-D-xylulose-5-phosphate reductoisomerase